MTPAINALGDPAGELLLCGNAFLVLCPRTEGPLAAIAFDGDDRKTGSEVRRDNGGVGHAAPVGTSTGTNRIF